MSADSGPIQVQPAGLLGLLDLKANGQAAPDVLLGNVQPTVGLLSLWLNAKRQPLPVVDLASFITNNYTVPASPWTPPQNEWWFVHSACARFFSNNMADQAFGRWYLEDPGGRVVWAPSASLASIVTTSGNTVLGLDPLTDGPGLWVPPGYRLSYARFGVTLPFVGAVNYRADGDYTPLRV